MNIHFNLFWDALQINNLITSAGSSFMQAVFRSNVFWQTFKHTLHYNLHTSVVRMREKRREKNQKMNKITPLFIPIPIYLFLHILFYRYRTVWFEKFPASLNILTSPIIECMNLPPSGVTKQQQQQKSSWCIYPSLSVAVSLRCVLYVHRRTPRRKKIQVMIRDYILSL